MIETAQAIGDIISVINGPNNAPPRLYTAQFFEHFGVNCNVNADASGPFRNVGFHLIDTVMTKFFDVNVANCRAGIEEENASGDSERNEFINVHLLCNMDGWLFQQDKGNANNSFEHQTWVGNYVSTCNPAGENVFHLVGGAQLLNSYVQFNGNIYGNSTTLFELDGGSALINSTVDVWPEADGTPKQHQYAFGEAGVGPAGFSNACQSNLACVIVSGHISGYLEFQNGSQWAVLHVADPFKVPQHIGTLSTTASTSDTFSSAFIVYQDACFISPMNSSAAAMVSSTFIADVRRGSLVVRHPAIAGATFQVWCN